MVIIDIETTGLDVNKCSILEIAMLRYVGGRIIDHFHMFLEISKNTYWEEYALDMHRKNGLWLDCLENGQRDYQVKYEMSRFFNWISERELAFGKNLGHFDALFLERFHPDFSKKFGHRFLDLGNLYYDPVKEYIPSLVDLTGNSASHRAYDECKIMLDLYEKKYPPNIVNKSDPRPTLHSD